MFGARVFFEYVLDLIYPETCHHCASSIQLSEGDGKKPDHKNIFFCIRCWETIERLSQESCPVCSAPFQSDSALSHSPDHVCGDCREAPPYFSCAITPYRYEGVMARAICLLKYEKRTGLAKNLVNLLMDDFANTGIDLVTAIPLHASRLRFREFNQSLLLAREVSRRKGWPLRLDALTRTRETAPQVGLSKKKRKKNMHQAFRLRHPNEVLGKRILLMDDVYTTGATLKEGAKTLIKGGAKEVVVCTPARMVFGEGRKSMIDHSASDVLKTHVF